MRKVLKILGWIAAGGTALIAFGAVMVYFSSNAKLAKKFTVAVKPVAPTGNGRTEKYCRILRR